MIRVEKKKHMCSVANCRTVTECFMITKLSNNINAVYLCPECAKAIADFGFKTEPKKTTPTPAPNVVEVVDIEEPVVIKKKAAAKK